MSLDGGIGRRRHGWRTLAVLTALAGLVACTGSGAGEVSGTTSTTSAAPEGGRTAYAVPDSCVALGLDPRTKLPGAAVATCWGDALSAHGTVRAWTNGPPEIEAEVVLDAPPRLRTTAPDGRVVVVVDGTAYGLTDGRWTRGVLNSEVEDEAVAAATGEFASATFSPQGLRQGVGECPTWTVAAERETVTLSDGSAPSGLVRLDCSSPFALSGATTTAASLWVREDWTPVRHVATLSIGGVEAESVRDLSAHGTGFDIPTPAP